MPSCQNSFVFPFFSSVFTHVQVFYYSCICNLHKKIRSVFSWTIIGIGDGIQSGSSSIKSSSNSISSSSSSSCQDAHAANGQTNSRGQSLPIEAVKTGFVSCTDPPNIEILSERKIPLSRSRPVCVLTWQERNPKEEVTKIARANPLFAIICYSM
jgi:hypothetical protein